MKKVKVQIKEGYEDHYHAGKRCEPGDIIEVTPLQASWLHKIGATKPVKAPKKREASTPKEEESPEADIITEGGEETPES